MTRKKPDSESVARFWSKVQKSSGCWIWTGGLNHDGYGSFCYNGTSALAHCIAYDLTAGAVPDGLELDHLCRVRRCVNPAHLEPVTHRVNVLRGEWMGARHARKTHCPRGHNYVAKNGRRYCNECRNEHRAAHVDEYRAKDRERYAANREARCASQRMYNAKKKTSSPGDAPGKEIA